MYLSANVPHFEVLVRKEFLYNQEAHHKEFESGVCFGVSSITNRAFGFHVLLDNGAIFWRLPLHAFAWKDNANPLDISEAQLWDNISYNIAVTKYDYLKDRECKFKTRTKREIYGKYLFTIDYAESEYSESADEHKCSHILRGSDGNFYSMPNNYLRWFDSSRIKQINEPLDYKANTYIWHAEKINEVTDNNFFYEIKDES
jgi:hypothetical protein